MDDKTLVKRGTRSSRVFLSVVVVSNSNYGKSVEEVTALMAEKETLLAQDQNANESDPEASTEKSHPE